MSTYFSAEDPQSFGPAASDIETFASGTPLQEASSVQENLPRAEPSPDEAQHQPTNGAYLFGKIFCNYVLAEALCCAAKPRDNMQELDAQLQMALTSLVESECLTRLKAMLHDSKLSFNERNLLGSEFEDLMTAIGILGLSRKDGVKADLAQMIRVYGQLCGTAATGQILPPSPPQSDTAETTRQVSRNRPASVIPRNAGDAGYRAGIHSPDRIRLDEPNLGSYATRLKGYCDSRGHGWDHSAEKTAATSAKWAAIVKVGGKQFTGSARTKKEAKHKAMQAACIEFGI